MLIRLASSIGREPGPPLLGVHIGTLRRALKDLDDLGKKFQAAVRSKKRA